MKPTLVALYGPHSSGKSATIKVVYDKLKEANNEDWNDNGPINILAVLTIDGIKIGINGAGDLERIVAERLEKLKDCHIIVCAVFWSSARATKPIKFVRRFAEQSDYTDIWIKKEPSEKAHRKAADQEKAREIIGCSW